jgi:hypothetical protein
LIVSLVLIRVGKLTYFKLDYVKLG